MTVLIKPIMTEKAVRMIETENKILFIVERKARKEEIKQEFETIFENKIKSINVYIRKNQKIAIIKLKEASAALNVATKLGLM